MHQTAAVPETAATPAKAETQSATITIETSVGAQPGAAPPAASSWGFSLRRRALAVLLLRNGAAALKLHICILPRLLSIIRHIVRLHGRAAAAHAPLSSGPAPHGPACSAPAAAAGLKHQHSPLFSIRGTPPRLEPMLSRRGTGRGTRRVQQCAGTPPQGCACMRLPRRTSSTSLLGAENELIKSTMCWCPRLSASSTGVLSILRASAGQQPAIGGQALRVLAVPRRSLPRLLAAAMQLQQRAFLPHLPGLQAANGAARPAQAASPASPARPHVLRAEAEAPASRSRRATASWPMRHAQCSAVLPLSLAAATFCAAAVGEREAKLSHNRRHKGLSTSRGKGEAMRGWSTRHRAAASAGGGCQAGRIFQAGTHRAGIN